MEESDGNMQSTDASRCEDAEIEDAVEALFDSDEMEEVSAAANEGSNSGIAIELNDDQDLPGLCGDSPNARSTGALVTADPDDDHILDVSGAVAGENDVTVEVEKSEMNEIVNESRAIADDSDDDSDDFECEIEFKTVTINQIVNVPEPPVAAADDLPAAPPSPSSSVVDDGEEEADESLANEKHTEDDAKPVETVSSPARSAALSAKLASSAIKAASTANPSTSTSIMPPTPPECSKSPARVAALSAKRVTRSGAHRLAQCSRIVVQNEAEVEEDDAVEPTPVKKLTGFSRVAVKSTPSVAQDEAEVEEDDAVEPTPVKKLTGFSRVAVRSTPSVRSVKKTKKAKRASPKAPTPPKKRQPLVMKPSNISANEKAKKAQAAAKARLRARALAQKKSGKANHKENSARTMRGRSKTPKAATSASPPSAKETITTKRTANASSDETAPTPRSIKTSSRLLSGTSSSLRSTRSRAESAPSCAQPESSRKARDITIPKVRQAGM